MNETGDQGWVFFSKKGSIRHKYDFFLGGIIEPKANTPQTLSTHSVGGNPATEI